MKFLSSFVALSSATSVAFASYVPSKTCSPDFVSPKPKLPKGAFDLEGYGKDNPIGPVSGGKGGPTTTISATDQAALATAVAVSFTAKGYKDISDIFRAPTH